MAGILAAGAKAALEALKKRAGKGATDTFKSGGKQAEFGNTTKITVDDPGTPKGGFEADLINKTKIKKKKKLTAEQQKLKELEDAKKGAAVDTSKTDDEIALKIATNELGGDLIGHQLKHAGKTTTKTKNLSKLKKQRAAKAAAKTAAKTAGKARKSSSNPVYKRNKRDRTKDEEL